MTDEEWLALAVQVSRMPGLWRGLLRDHRSNRDGLCVGCTRPGYGTPHRAWPCHLWRLSERAAALYPTFRPTKETVR